MIRKGLIKSLFERKKVMDIQRRFQKAIKKNEKAMEELRNYTSNSEQVNKAITDRLIKLNENNRELKWHYTLKLNLMLM